MRPKCGGIHRETSNKWPNGSAMVSPSELAAQQLRSLQLPELARLGFVEGRNLTSTTHVGPPTRMPELAREAIATKPDVVIAVSTVAILAVKEASSTMSHPLK